MTNINHLIDKSVTTNNSRIFNQWYGTGGILVESVNRGIDHLELP